MGRLMSGFNSLELSGWRISPTFVDQSVTRLFPFETPGSIWTTKGVGPRPKLPTFFMFLRIILDCIIKTPLEQNIKQKPKEKKDFRNERQDSHTPSRRPGPFGADGGASTAHPPPASLQILSHSSPPLWPFCQPRRLFLHQQPLRD